MKTVGNTAIGTIQNETEKKKLAMQWKEYQWALSQLHMVQYV